MDATLHAIPRYRPRRTVRWVSFARTAAVLTLGIGLGIVASLPAGGGAAVPTLVAVLAASAAAVIAYLRPRNAPAIVVVDVLLGLAVLATVFGHLGILYLPSMLAFLVVTTRIEPAGVMALEDEPASPLDWSPYPAPASPLDWSPSPAIAESSSLDAASGPRRREAGRHRAPSGTRRTASVLLRAGSALGHRARTGIDHIRASLATEPGELEIRVPEASEPEPPPTRPRDVTPTPRLDELRSELEAGELELVAAGKPLSSLAHRAYGELRFLSTPPGLEERKARSAIEIDDEALATPSWHTLGDR
jgi:hypothetical protein